MKNIDQRLFNAVRDHLPFCDGNTCVTWDGDRFTVSLYGHVIARGENRLGIGNDPGGFVIEYASFAGHPTNTTSRRLRALGVDTEAIRIEEGYK